LDDTESDGFAFDVNILAISKHLKNIFASGELNEQVAVSKMETVQRKNKVHIIHVNRIFQLSAFPGQLNKTKKK